MAALTDEAAGKLAALACELAGRVREYPPQDNARWLLARTDTADRWGMLFVMAAALPVERPWGELIEWVGMGKSDYEKTRDERFPRPEEVERERDRPPPPPRKPK